MRTRTVALALAVGAAGALIIACGASSAEGAFGADDANPGGGGADGGALAPGDNAGATGNPSVLPVADDGIILVHAANAPPFRLCFGNDEGIQPQPNAQVMPQANVVGVDVGAAVRIDPLKPGPAGDVYYFDEGLIRGLYGTNGNGPSCQTLLGSSVSQFAIPVGTISQDLSVGLHLLVLRGCPADSGTKYSTAECGDTWTSATGNLEIDHDTINGYARTDPNALPVQIVDVSSQLESVRAGRTLSLAFGDLTSATPLPPSISAIAAFTDPVPNIPLALPYPQNDLAIYDSWGFRVTLGGDGVGDGGAAAEKVLDQSLASVQALSSPDDVPPTYYAQASSYVLLLLGDPAPKLQDGGADDDPLRNLHLLAVPVVQANPDAGPPGDGGADLDAGGGG